ncbi:MAG: cytochrome c oxidase subunit II [Oscillatoriophycideae cyanobacterium NC_groundwater_1537_Pr4_S-0.65um_50_18]|nr:cytochrome c oxidase subunit II [Oscillatoriophycideae cyanobacterium NC_groundwater_1537_Pr4_S-0.65um_50_18]
MKVQTIFTLIAIAILITFISLWMGQQAYSWVPPQASAESKLIDDLFSFLVVLGTFIFLGVGGTILYSILFFRAGKYDFSDGPPIEGNITLEVVWTVIPIALVIWIASYSYQIYSQMAIRGPMEIVHLHNPVEMQSAYAAPEKNPETQENVTQGAPESAVMLPPEEIEVHSRQWAWEFRYPDQNVTSTELHLPVDRRVKLALQSEDVLHGFYIPAFRLKQDIIPNRTIDFEFTPIRIGKYRLEDSQFSGTYFAVMQADVLVESPEDYQQWLVSTAMREPSPAYNQAAAEYSRYSDKAIKPGWPTVVPAPAPIVNQPSATSLKTYSQ